MRPLAFICFICVAFSCTKKKGPIDILSPDKMEAVLWEQLKADAYTREFISRDSTKDVVKENLILQEKIFKKHHTDRASFYKSYDWYLAHEEQMRSILDSVIAKEGRVRERERTRKYLKLRNYEQSKKQR